MWAAAAVAVCAPALFAEIRLDAEDGVVPFSGLFYRAGYHALHSVTDTYGALYAGAGTGTYGMVVSGADWAWNRMAYNNPPLVYAGLPAGIIGGALPVALPVGLYLYGRYTLQPETQRAALAMGQAAMLASIISSGLKFFTGRRSPELFGNRTLALRQSGPDDYSADFDLGFGRRGIFNGWPSSHTAIAFAMAAALANFYPENRTIKIGAYAYAGFIGLGMSLFGHWASESVAGALIGYAIGAPVGKGFRKAQNAPADTALPGITLGKNLAFYPAPGCALILMRY